MIRVRGLDQHIRRRCLEQVIPSSLEHQRAAADDTDDVCYLVYFSKDMTLYHDACAMISERADQPAHLLYSGRIQTVGGLIQYQ